MLSFVHRNLSVVGGGVTQERDHISTKKDFDQCRNKYTHFPLMNAFPNPIIQIQILFAMLIYNEFNLLVEPKGVEILK